MRRVSASSWTSIHGINIMHVMPASTITMADFRLLWGPCLRERLPLDILSHCNKISWLSSGQDFWKFSLARRKTLGCPGPSERRIFEAWYERKTYVPSCCRMRCPPSLWGCRWWRESWRTAGWSGSVRQTWLSSRHRWQSLGMSYCRTRVNHVSQAMCRKIKKIMNKEGRQEMFYLTTHSTHFIYGYMASDIW